MLWNNQLEPGVVDHFLHAHPWVSGCQAHAAGASRAIIVIHQRQGGDYIDRSSAYRQSSVFTRMGAREVARSGEEIHFGHEAPFIMLHDGHRAPTLAAHVVAAPATGQACLGMVMLADRDGVQVTVWVDLRPTQE